jgi:ubiquitin carboxyl-terminal hydrolase 8
MLEIPEGANTIENCLDGYFQNEIFDGENSYFCQYCKHLRHASKTTTLVKLPTNLVIQFKRFSSTHLGATKIERNIDFPIENFNLANYIHFYDEPSPQLYDLYSISVF